MAARPNILLFLMDGAQASALEPDSPCRTPNFDRLRERGVLFRRAYTATPTCSPARASLLTGMLPHNHGVLEVEHGRDPDQCVLRTDKPHWAQRLRDSGYRTAYFGKWHVERTNDLSAFGWEINKCKAAEHHQFLGQGKDGGARLEVDPQLCRHLEGPSGYNRVLHYGVTDIPAAERCPAFTVRQARETITELSDGDAPWCTCLSFSEPNEALVVSRDTFMQYDAAAIPLPDNLRDDLSGRPNLYRRQRDISAAVTDDEWRMARTCYYGRITELDAEFGRLLDDLESSGEIDNTIIIVTADHGRYVGAHGFDAHNFGAFEEIYRIPLIVAGPGIAAGCETNGLVNFQDLCPTILELTGNQAFDVADSRSFTPLLRDPVANEADFNEAYGEYHGTRFSLAQRILWQGDWKFVFNGFDYDELYNLHDDPGETTNLINRPEHRERADAMMAGIWRIIRETGDRTLAETHYYSMRFARVGPNPDPQARPSA
jgi:choline-sulfatase